MAVFSRSLFYFFVLLLAVIGQNQCLLQGNKLRDGRLYHSPKVVCWR